MQGDAPTPRTHGWLPAALRRIELSLSETSGTGRGVQKVELASVLLSQASADLIELATPVQMAALLQVGADLDALERKLKRQQTT